MKTQKIYKKGAPQGAPFLEIMVADSFLLRLRGLMGRKELPDRKGLLLAPCDSIHMCFMRFPIDVIYLDKNYTVLKVVKNLRPWTGLSMCRGAWAALELNAGETERLGCEVGWQFVLETGDKK